jgi:hypothetical protein
MPKPNFTNPICPYCGKHTTFNKNLPSGAKQYRCRRHKPNFTCTNSDRPEGGQLLGDRKLTQKELSDRWKANDPEGYRAAQNRKQEKRKKLKNK